MPSLKGLADNQRPGSLASRMRARRNARFAQLLATLERPVRVLDVGGSETAWGAMPAEAMRGVEVTSVNLQPQPATRPGFSSIAGDARDLAEIADDAFDVAYSNSVIEHVGSLADQARMAAEVRRVASRHYVQTPNRWFVIEPHFLVPGFQFLPARVRARMLQRRDLGWMPRTPDFDEALAEVTQVRLLTAAELRRLFPTSQLERERVAGLTKSLTVIGGWNEGR